MQILFIVKEIVIILESDIHKLLRKFFNQEFQSQSNCQTSVTAVLAGQAFNNFAFCMLEAALQDSEGVKEERGRWRIRDTTELV